MKNIFINNALRIVIFFLLLLTINSCAFVEKNLLRKRPIYETNFTEKGSPEFHQGWNDGCVTGMSSGDNPFYKMFDASNQADGYKMSNSADYRRAWTNAYWYCYRRVYIKQKSSVWGATFGGYFDR